MVCNEVSWGTNRTDYPAELLKNMRPDDEVVAFVNITEKSKGCLSRKTKNTGNSSFLAITHERVIGTAEVVSEEGSGLKKSRKRTVITFNIPLVKVTSLSTSSDSTTSGCLKKSHDHEYFFSINAQGSKTVFYTGKNSQVNDEIVKSFLEVSDYF